MILALLFNSYKKTLFLVQINPLWKYSSLLFIFFLFSSRYYAKAQNVEEFFGNDYHAAVRFVKEHKAQFVQHAQGLSGDSCLSEGDKARVFASVVFPEIVRHSRFKDFFETAAIEYGYVQGGRQVANYSIGSFQMRPSFVEDLEQYAQQTKLHKLYDQLRGFVSDTPREIRKERVERLRTLYWQMFYLYSFFRIAHQITPVKKFTSPEKYLRYMASLYNYGLTRNTKAIHAWSRVKAFPMGSSFTGKQYSYAEVALFFFHHDAPSIFCPKY